MKTRARKFIVTAICLSVVCTMVRGQNTAFTYQGRLNDGGSPAAGNYDLTFALFNSSSGGSSVAGPVTNSVVSITNGLFTVQLDFGSGIFDGTTYWLQVGVRTNGGGAFTALNSRQQLTPAPYAIYSASAGSSITLSGALPASGLSGTYTNPIVLNNPANSFTGNGAGISNVNATSLNGLAASNFWQTAGNGGTSPTNGNFLGTTDHQPLELHVNGVRALRLEPAPANGSPNIVGGSMANVIGAGVVGATISGGGSTNDSGSAETNSIGANYASIGGGGGHTINGGSDYALVAGGKNNLVDSNSYASAVVGGAQNSIFQNTDHSYIGGGYFNIIVPFFGSYDVIGGGENNAISGAFLNDVVIAGGNGNQAQKTAATVGGGGHNTAGAAYSTVSGGASNTVSGDFGAVSGGYSNTVSGQTAFVAGGEFNAAAADRTFAGGSGAKATNEGAFVWADYSTNSSTAPFPFSSSNRNEFAARATGGVRFVTAVNPSSGVVTAGIALAPGGTSWATLSDRDAKKDFAPIDSQLILNQLSSVPVQQWHYKWEDSSGAPNIGPMAQDFVHAFYPGRDDKSITTLEFDGVELAAIQALNEKLKARDAEIQNLESRLEQLERIVNLQNPKPEVKP
jgi:hypothetical protein